MQCPYCKKDLIPGYIYGNRSPLVWVTEDKKPTLGIDIDGEILRNSRKGLFELPNIRAYKCTNCKKIIVILE